MENGRTRGARGEWVVALIILALFCYLLVMPYAQGHWRLADDAYMGNLTYYVFQERVLKQDHAWPQWILNVGVGHPAALIPGATWYYPLQVLWGLVVGWSELSYVYFLYLHLLGGALIAWTLARCKLGLTEAASLFAAMAFVGNGYALGTFSNFNQLIPYLVWPLMMAGLIDLHRDEKPWRGVLEIEIAAFVIEVDCYPLLKILMVLATAVGYWAMARKPGTWGRGLKWKPILLACGIAAICSAPEWVSTFRYVGLADRLGVDFYDEAIYNSPTSFLSLVTALLPNLFQHRDVHELGVLWLERSWWLGTMTLLAVWLALRDRSVSLRRFHVPAALAFAGFLFALGGHSFARELASAAVPPLRHLRHAVYARFLPMGFLCFLGAYCLSQLEGAGAEKPAARSGRGRQAATPAAGVSPPPSGRAWVAWLWGAYGAALVAVAISESDTLFNAQAPDLYGNASAGWKLALLHSGFYLLLGYTLYSRRTTLFGRFKWPYALVALQFVSMADAAYAFRRIVAKEEPLRPLVEENFAVASPHPNERSIRRWFDTDDWLQWYGNKAVLNAYDTPHHKDLEREARDPRVAPLVPTLVSCQDGSAGPLPVATQGDSCKGLSFTIDRYFGNVVQVSGESASPAVIAVHDQYDPGWKATVNGTASPVFPIFDAFKGVEVPAGRWTARFEFVDPAFPALWFVSALGWLLLVFGPRVIPAAWVASGED